MKKLLLTLALVSGVAFADCHDQKQQRPGDQKDCDKQEQQQKQDVKEQIEQIEQVELGQELANHHRWICFAADERGRSYRGIDRDRFDARRKALASCRHGHHHRCRITGCRRHHHH